MHLVHQCALSLILEYASPYMFTFFLILGLMVSVWVFPFFFLLLPVFSYCSFLLLFLLSPLFLFYLSYSLLHPNMYLFLSLIFCLLCLVSAFLRGPDKFLNACLRKECVSYYWFLEKTWMLHISLQTEKRKANPLQIDQIIISFSCVTRIGRVSHSCRSAPTAAVYFLQSEREQTSPSWLGSSSYSFTKTSFQGLRMSFDFSGFHFHIYKVSGLYQTSLRHFPVLKFLWVSSLIHFL